MTWPVEKENSCKRNPLALYEIIAKEIHCPVTLRIENVSAHIHEQQMLHSTMHEAIIKPFLSLRVFVDENLTLKIEV